MKEGYFLQWDRSVPDTVSISTSEDTSESSFDSVETSIEESKVQADFAEQTANEMKEWMNFWDAYDSTPGKKFANQPTNSLAWEEDNNYTEQVTLEDFVEETSLSYSTFDYESVYCETPALVTPPRCRTRCSGFDMDECSIPSIVPCTPFSPCVKKLPFLDEERNEKRSRRQVYSLLDFCDSHPDDVVSITANTVLDSCGSTSTSTEDLHQEVRTQRNEVDHVCRRIQWMEGCVVALHESSESESCESVEKVVLPALRTRDRFYLCGALYTFHAIDLAYIGFCSILPLEWLQWWIWFFQHTSKRSRRYLLAVLVVILTAIIPRLFLFPLQPPPRRVFPACAKCTAMSAPADDVFSDNLAEVLL